MNGGLTAPQLLLMPLQSRAPPGLISVILIRTEEEPSVWWKSASVGAQGLNFRSFLCAPVVPVQPGSNV